MTVTLVGQLLRPNQIATWYSGRYMRAATLIEHDDLMVADRVPLDVGHDGDPIGEVVYLERASDGGVVAVAVADYDELADALRPLYFSSDLRSLTTSPADAWAKVAYSPRLVGVAVTHEPACGDLTPVVVHRGDIRVGGWRGMPGSRSASRRCADVLDHAAKRLGTNSRRAWGTTRTPLTIYDVGGVDDVPVFHRTTGPGGDEALPAGLGPRRYSAPIGRVLSVR